MCVVRLQTQRSPTPAAPPDGHKGGRQAQVHCTSGCLNGTYKEHFRGCLTSLNTGAGLAAAPRSPPHGILPTTPHPSGINESFFKNPQFVQRPKVIPHLLPMLYYQRSLLSGLVAGTKALCEVISRDVFCSYIIMANLFIVLLIEYVSSILGGVEGCPSA